ncbi:MAG TPA: sodium:proton antiporter [Methanobacterium subterraneum]|uniref:Sodium:proton antiporter n=1 Tax=Methanobacterium subterraneum TaxID=59277 RepID=A0A7J4TLX7_9EURY|nr:sodium:proton antiporter [Methanobacterium subterraneum]
MSGEQILLGLGLIIGLGISLQWLARTIKIPGIILLLPAGMLVGPVLGLVKPLEIFGDSLFPIVTLGVGILLLKGGFELRIGDHEPNESKAVWRLITLGVIITLALGTLAVLVILKIPFILALLLASILVVSGPTVVGPILQFARPTEPVGSVLMWESIIIDPIGASLGVAVLSYIISPNPFPIVDIFLTIITGVIIGLIASGLYISAERSRRVPPSLSALVAFMFGIIAIVSGELIFSEAGLFAAVTMGLVVGNQHFAPAKGIEEFSETIEPLIIGMLFVMLAALVDLNVMGQYLIPALLLVGFYVFIVRPVVGLVATSGLGFDLAQRIFIGAMAPRGIVAAATASLFAISLLNAGVNFPHLMPMVFMVIIFTVAIYGLSAPILARKLKISRPGRDALAVMGDQPWIAGLTNSLHKAGCNVMLVAPDEGNVKRTRSEIPYVTYTGPLAQLADEEIIDEAHEFKNRVEWLIIATDDPDLSKIVQDTFIRQLGYLSMIVLGRYRQKQDEVIFAKGGSDMLINTPFGLFGRNQDEILDLLDKGGFFDAIDSTSQPDTGGVPTGMKPFLRVLSNGKLAVPGDTSPLNEGEWLIVVHE